MARRYALFARAARRAAMLLKGLSHERGVCITNLGHPRFTCPYCSSTLPSRLGRDRHIILSPYCRTRRVLELSGIISKHAKRRQKMKQHASDTLLPATEQAKRPRTDSISNETPPSKRAQMGHEQSLNLGPEKTPPADTESQCTSGGAPGIHDTSTKSTHPRLGTSTPLVEKFPIETAGAPVSDRRRGRELTREDLHDYLASCGSMGEPDKFEVAELLMTTGLSAKNRTRWLKSSLASTAY
ncbi:hypothetical protein RhiJN_17220 [Ceratobasidium sp. AG-Ba]|nr:hypothetical protein RhiJN_17220 [Ceratobasidium sp. AG-Ba]